MENFDALKKQLDDKVTVYKTEKRLHMLGVIEHWESQLLSYTEYVYSFSTEDKKD